MGPADLFIFDLEQLSIRPLVSDGSSNINLPGSAWNSVTGEIVFSSTRDPHDEIFVIDENGNPGSETKITNRNRQAAYEPSFSSDGQWIVFESHKMDVEENGIITKFKKDRASSYQPLTGVNEDCRQPNWSPTGERILFQKFENGQWDIWVMPADGTQRRQVTSGVGDKTDASFSPDGQWIVYSSDEGSFESANIFIIPVQGGNPRRVTRYSGYDGAPSWSPDGMKICFESYRGNDPDNSSGTTLWLIDAPTH